jgi:hypothetical protein
MGFGGEFALTQIGHAARPADQPDYQDAVGSEVSREPSRCGRSLGAGLCLLRR